MTLVRSAERLVDCPPKHTLHTLPTVVVERIERAQVTLNMAARPARTSDVIGLLVMLKAPTDGPGLRRLLKRPDSQLGCAPGGLSEARVKGSLVSGRQQLFTKLPSPVTHRLNGLVDLAQADVDYTTNRGQVVSALVVHAMPARRTLPGVYDTYKALTAGQARLPGVKLADVLQTQSPNPGVRPRQP